MISPEEIKQQALKWWKPFLQSRIINEPFFPKRIDRIGKVKPQQVTNNFEVLQEEIECLYNNSKDAIGVGYQVKTSGKNFRRTGTHNLPDAIEFETVEDYVNYIGKKKDWKLFQQNYILLAENFPQSTEWMVNNVISLTLPAKNWADIIKVCRYFVINPRPNLYIRQLPTQVHTKFIEENATLLQSLLNFLIPDHIRDSNQSKFAERFFLKHDEPLIRIRILDKEIAIYNNLMDLSICLSDFEKTDWACKNIFITENKMNFLTLPSFPTSIAIWSGGGFNISYLKNAHWLKRKKIFYWGDIDEHGFQILHQIRSYYAQTISVMMDKKTFDTFQEFAVDGERNKIEKLHHLTREEATLYSFLKQKEVKNRLEQEKIPQAYADIELSKFIHRLSHI